MYRVIALALFVTGWLGCGGSKGNEGPTYTPALANSVRGLAPTCEIAKGPNVDDVVEIRDCRGPLGTVTLALAPNDRVRRIDVKLRPMTRREARFHLEEGIGPLVGQDLRGKLMSIMDKLKTGERDTAESGSARLEVVVGGTNSLMPEYVVHVSW